MFGKMSLTRGVNLDREKLADLANELKTSPYRDVRHSQHKAIPARVGGDFPISI